MSSKPIEPWVHSAMVLWQPPRPPPPPPPIINRAPGQSYTPGHGIRSNYAFWKGKCLLVLRHHMDGMAITFEELLDHLSQWNSSISQIQESLLRQILKEDNKRFETITTTRALPSTSWKHSARPPPGSKPSNFVPTTPRGEDQSDDELKVQSMKAEIVSPSIEEEIKSPWSSSPSPPSPPPRKKVKQYFNEIKESKKQRTS
jgi:hypothetical protein